MSDTPETDAELKTLSRRYSMDMEGAFMEAIYFARKLERQRDQLLEALKTCEYEIMACLREDSVKAKSDILSALQTAYDAARNAIEGAK